MYVHVQVHELSLANTIRIVDLLHSTLTCALGVASVDIINYIVINGVSELFMYGLTALSEAMSKCSQVCVCVCAEMFGVCLTRGHCKASTHTHTRSYVLC